MSIPRIPLRRALATAAAATAALLAVGTAGASPHHQSSGASRAHDHDHSHRAGAPGYAPTRYAPARYAPARYAPSPPARAAYGYPAARGERVRAVRAGFPDRRSALLFRELDRDRSGQLDAGERAALASKLRRDVRSGDRRAANTRRAARLIRAGDRDRDRQLDDRELRAMLRDTTLAQIFAATDSNSDRMLAYKEIDRAPLLPELRRADADRSGYISWQELDDYLTAQRHPGARARWAPRHQH